MKQFILSMFFVTLLSLETTAQNIVKGIVKDSDSEEPLSGILVRVKKTSISQTTDATGSFLLQNLPNGKQFITLEISGYEKQNFPVNLNDNTIDLGEILLYKEDESRKEQDLGTVTITDDELNNDANAADNIAGLLQSSRGVFLRTAAFEWSSSFFRIRGLDSENSKVLINGVEMNKLYNGRPQWSNWGGLNDVLRNQEHSNGLAPSNYMFGGVLGSTHITTRASDYKAGGRVSYASSNRSYIHRAMATYSSGLLPGNWAFTIAASRRAADEGFSKGTSYNAYSTFVSVEKIFNDNHSLNLTSIYAFNKRGKSAPHTQEVYDLKGTKYNEYWGYQDGKIRNSRIKRIDEPIIMLNHYWNIGDYATLNTNMGYQFGELGNSRLDYSGGRKIGENQYTSPGANPSPVYYRDLPSFYVSNPKKTKDNASAYSKEQELLKNGQINWEDLYKANRSNLGGEAIYALYEDRSDDKQFTVNSILNYSLNENITINASLNYTNLKSENFASIIDLLGAKTYLDVNRYANGADKKQKDLLNPDRKVKVGERFKYNYELTSNRIKGFLQGQFKYNKIDFFLAGGISKTDHQRDGLYKNGSFPNSSLGKSKKVNFTNFGIKTGGTYKITGRHLVDINAGYLTKAPSLRNSFSNARENNSLVRNLVSEKIFSFDASYILRSPVITSKITGFYIDVQDATNISYFFADGIGGDGSAFIQEITTGSNKRHFGGEFGVEVTLTPTVKVRGAATVGQYTYSNNPNVYVTTESNKRSEDAGFVDGFRDFGKSNLKNYKLSNGPQKAYSVGFEYRDPDYWWFSTSANLLSEAYISVSPLMRTSNFYTNFDGLPLNNYDTEVAKRLLQQEKIDTYTTVNAVGGKSWRIKNYFVGFFASINNIFNTKYKTGGFENSRNANYETLKEHKKFSTPMNGSKYWYGRGTTYFLNVYFRF